MNRQFEYFIKNFQLFYNTEGIEIGYGKQNKSITICKNCEDSFWLEQIDIDNKNIIWKEWNDVKIPFLFENSVENEIITLKDNRAKINYDIVSSAFYFLSGWNEHVNPSKDEFGRVSYENSIIKRLNIPNIPVVNYYFSILFKAIRMVYKKDTKKSLWGDNNLVISLTHDIDTCKSCWLEGSFSELKKKRFFSIPKLIFKRFFTKDEWFNFKDIVDIERKYDASSSFFFLPQKGKIEKWKNADYKIKSKSIQQVISFLNTQNKEVGVHGSFGTHTNSEMLQNDISRINHKPIMGNRFHFLMFDPEKTVSVLEECNIKYDTSLCFAEQIGFRRGTCYPFYIYNFEKEHISSVVEIPLIVMDSSLSFKKYMGLNIYKALAKVYELIDEVKKHNGVFTLLWHNTFFSDYKYTGWKDAYIKILDYCKANNGLLTSGKTIYEKITKL